MSQFVTLSKKDDQFWPLLTGRFSKTEFAQPIRNLYVNSQDETVTFKIVDQESLSLLGALAQWYSLARNIYLIFPILGGVAYLVSVYGGAPVDLLVSSMLSLQFFLMALTLYNDYSDYVNGVDRVNEFSSQKPLVMGMMRPYQAKQLAVVFLLISIALASYCLVAKPLVIVFAALAFLVGGIVTSTLFSRHLKSIGMFASFVLAGPLLVLGYEYLLFDHLSVESALLGFVFGVHALKYDFCKQVRSIFYNSKAKVSTVSTFFGFEKSKILYTMLSIAHISVLFLFSMKVHRPELLLVIVVSLCFEIYLNRLFYGAQSFLSSNISQCLSLQKLHYTIEISLLIVIFTSPLWLS